MSTRTHHDAWVCTDCYFAHHYGRHQDDQGNWFAGESDIPADCPPLDMLTSYELSDNTCSNHDVEGHPCAQCGREDYEDGIDTFSSSRCEGCGSHLGGSRYRLAVWE